MALPPRLSNLIVPTVKPADAAPAPEPVQSAAPAPAPEQRAAADPAPPAPGTEIDREAAYRAAFAGTHLSYRGKNTYRVKP